MKKLCREVWIEVDLDAIKKNVRAIRRHIPNTSKIMAVVKANAYGHGSVEVARQALESGASELAVASVEEGIVLRRAGITAPILVLGFTALSCVKKSAVWNITLSAFQVSWIKKRIGYWKKKQIRNGCPFISMWIREWAGWVCVRKKIF